MKRKSLGAPHVQLLIALVSGALLGILFHQAGPDTKAWVDGLSSGPLAAIGQVFLRLIFMIVVPMVFSALVLGVYELGQGHALGRVAMKTLGYTLLASSASVVIGVTLVNLLRPGQGFEIGAFQATLEAQSAAVQTIQKNASSAKTLLQSLVEIIPRNPVDSAARAFDGEMIPLMFFALVFGLALSFTLRGAAGRPAGGPGEERREPVLIEGLQQIFGASMKIVSFAMKLAPVAVFCLVFNTSYRFGHEILLSLLFYVGVVVLGLLIQQFGVYSLLLKLIARRSPLDFFRRCREVYLYAFSTASSNATLPRSLETAQHDLGLRPEISRFVLTVGSTANQNGTALFEGITVLFLAQVYSVDLSLAQQVQVVLMSILAGIGTAGVPGGSLPLIMILLQQVGIPAEGMGLILGVDRFLDMCRTTLNVSGDLVIAALVDSEGEKTT